MREHGEFTIELKGLVIHTHAYSSFNLEGANAFYQTLFEKVKDLDQWVIYSSIYKDTGATPEAMEASLAYNLQLKDKGCIAIANFTDNPILKKATIEMNQLIGLPEMVSNNREELETFIQQQLSEYGLT